MEHARHVPARENTLYFERTLQLKAIHSRVGSWLHLSPSLALSPHLDSQKKDRKMTQTLLKKYHIFPVGGLSPVSFVHEMPTNSPLLLLKRKGRRLGVCVMHIRICFWQDVSSLRKCLACCVHTCLHMLVFAGLASHSAPYSCMPTCIHVCVFKSMCVCVCVCARGIQSLLFLYRQICIAP